MDDIEDVVPVNGDGGVVLPDGAGSVVRRATRRGQQRRPRAQQRPDGVPCGQAVWLRTFGCSHNTSDSEYMAGLLTEAGYEVTDDFDAADCFLINSCTVKNPSEERFLSDLRRAKATGKPAIVSGCVPSGDPHSEGWADVSVIGVQQIHRVAEVVGEALRGHHVRLLSKGRRAGLPDLALPKVRRNPWIEIVPINAGCLNKCTYCKTKHARGDLHSWSIADICERVRQVLAEGVKEVWLTSEDTGAYGKDIGTDIVELMRAVSALIPEGAMLRLGMTNPPYIMDHLEGIAELLNHPRVYSFLHCPVQAGSNGVLDVMAREYTVEDFRKVCDVLRKRVPHITIATDIICGFPSESEEDFAQTLKLCADYKFSSLYISQFYPRRGTPAAGMKQLSTATVKDRSRRLTQLFESYTADQYRWLVGSVQRVLITEKARDGVNLVGHTKGYVQVLIPPDSARVGSEVRCKIVSATRHSVVGAVVGDESVGARPVLLRILVCLVLLVAVVCGLYGPPSSWRLPA
eukprot:TRINITY_DN40673_c0_g1_i1.p1 TRINITY_DN40673_c0_g1~~TRINITY_DN40673_c0_g1_i1.p1  ORF type:complete len:517 (+),score=127.87 TRINITY_DN40673_c0_g1_i1:61-1611(+)